MLSHRLVLLLAVLEASSAFSFSALSPAALAAGRSISPQLRRTSTTMASGLKMSAATSKDCACTIIGAGRIGTALSDMGKASSIKDSVVKRGEPILENEKGPIYVTTRNDDLEGVVKTCPKSRIEDLVFYGQNGYIEDFLKKQDLAEKCTQVLVYMAVAKLGEKPTDGVTDMNPEGLTSVYGKWADQVAARLHGAGMSCHVLNRDQFRQRMFEKHMWICTFMLVGAHYGITVGEVESKHKGEVTQMVEQMMLAIKEETGVTFEAGVPERLLSYARSVSHFPTALKEFDWRNKYFLDLSMKRKEKGLGELTPLHTEMLTKAKEAGKVKF